MSQRAEGNQNVQIKEVADSSITVIYNSVPRLLPLEPAEIPISAGSPSPARLVNARAGVFGFVGRAELQAELEEWIDAADPRPTDPDSPAPFAAYLIAGRGGSGKTRLAVELCLHLRESGWVCGFLTRGDGEGRLDALIETPTPRLIVVDYAENRTEQLERLLPQLSAGATAEHPVRVLMLVRTGPGEVEDVPGRLKTSVQSVKRVIEGCHVRVLEESRERLSREEREELFAAAAAGLADYVESPAPISQPPDLDQEIFENPLMVVIAAYLAAQGEQAPDSRGGLLDGVLEHERGYWQQSAAGPDADDVLLERVVAIATLLRVESEAEGADHLLLHPDLAEEPLARRNRLARWVRDQYPGPRWWNPLEPDLLGEHLVARCFTDQPAVLLGALATSTPENLTRPLEVLGRAAVDHPELADALSPILSEELPRLCQVAIDQAETARDRDLLYGNVITVATAIEALLAEVPVEGEAVVSACLRMPPRADLLLNSLAFMLTAGTVHQLRLATKHDPTRVKELAANLNDLSNRLADAGRHAEALEAIEEAVELQRELVEVDRATNAPGLATILNNLSVRLGESGRRSEALAPIEESIAIYRELVEEDPAFRPDLASSLSNLANRLSEAIRSHEAVESVEESVAIYRELIEEKPGEFEPDLAMSLNNLSAHLPKVGRSADALTACEEAVAIRRRLAEEKPAAHARNLVVSLNNLSGRLADAGRREEGLARCEEAVIASRSLMNVDTAVFAPDFATSVHTLAIRLAEVGRREESLAAGEEAVEVYRGLFAANPGTFAPKLANSLNNVAIDLAAVDRAPEAVTIVEEATDMYRRLVAENPGLFEPDLADLVSNLSNRLLECNRRTEALAATEEVVTLRRIPSHGNPAAQLAALADALHGVSRLSDAGGPEAVAAVEESVAIYRSLAETLGDALSPALASALNSLGVDQAAAGSEPQALAAFEEAVAIRRTLTAADPSAHAAGLLGSLRNLAVVLREVGRTEEAEAAATEAAALEEQAPA